MNVDVKAVVATVRRMIREPDGITNAERLALDALCQIAEQVEVAAPPPDTQRLEYIIKLALERSIWLTHQNIPEGSIAHMEDGPHRWIIGGQGVGTTGSGKTLREAIDVARQAASLSPSRQPETPQ